MKCGCSNTGDSQAARAKAARVLVQGAPLALLAALACGTEPAASATALVEPTRWQASADADDPFISTEQPATGRCDSFGYGVEELDGETVFFASTASCKYLTVEQPARRAVAAGETLAVELFHYDLTSERPAEGHAALALGERVIWEYTTAIPAVARTQADVVTLDEPLAEGAPIFFHVHNHGDNEWILVHLLVQP